MAATALPYDLHQDSSKDNLSSWAEQVEIESSKLPPLRVERKGDIKTVTDYRFGENEEIIKVVSTFKVVTKVVPKPIAERSRWRKFGDCGKDPAGVNPANTYVSDQVTMQFVRNRAGEKILNEMDAGDMVIKKSGASGGGVQCRYCKQDHWSVNCPYKDMGLAENEEAAAETTGDPKDHSIKMKQNEAENKMKGGTYVPPAARRGGVVGPGSTMDSYNRRDENTVRVTNLPEDTDDADLKDLFGKMGRVTRIYLAKDKATNRCKGFAFVTYERKEDAEKAILTVSGHRYEHCILKVEWARQNNP